MADNITVIISVVILIFVIRYIFGGPSRRSSDVPQTYPTQANSAPRYRVTPDKVEAVLSMFPHFPRQVVEADLGQTGSVERTIENILSNRLVAPPPPEPVGSSPSPTKASLAESIDFSKPAVEPPRVWEQTPEGRQANLRARKEFMVRQARAKLLEKQQASEEQASPKSD
ncbi:uncharacterized protein BJ171DRAFT_493330 [Polychytrium aggregatum]|uniref:uncharacterized protein n=1 Tax=Polychytrium aggregatum TaxID=110093 RepID=UPI0022FE9D65|nr:uncharacterized protein BJ171DRAFT_493330 [Polychytrium aggregatum]KAI9207661.1 hypothetical protein BJ171DRAFT_493330 [Polychytrium aggregatum]